MSSRLRAALTLSAYRSALRAAKKAPDWSQRETMLTYARLKFQENKDCSDPVLVTAHAASVPAGLTRDCRFKGTCGRRMSRRSE